MSQGTMPVLSLATMVENTLRHSKPNVSITKVSDSQVTDAELTLNSTSWRSPTKFWVANVSFARSFRYPSSIDSTVTVAGPAKNETKLASGVVVGDCEGPALGACEGIELSVGCEEGPADGMVLGGSLTVGLSDMDGDELGMVVTDGSFEGTSEGDIDGTTDGLIEGTKDGPCEG